MATAYRTVQQQACLEIVINKSRFIGYCFPVSEEGEAQQRLEEIRKQHWDATHNCFAYSIGERGSIARYSDDGEPGGTAGLPMMEVLRQKNVTNVLCVVTRYFGGVLLGAGGLVRAYSRAASEAVEAAGIVSMRPCICYKVVLDYSRWGVLEGLLRSQGNLQDVEFTDCITAAVMIEAERAEAFEKLVTERTDGRVCPQAVGEAYGVFPI